MAIDLHYIMPSPPCRAVMILARQLGIELNLINVDMWQGAHLNEEFAKINPLKQVPVLNDNGFILGESRTILAYLVNQYSSGHKLYPVDPKKRANIDRILYLTAELWERFRLMAKQLFQEKSWPIKEELKTNYYELLKVLEQLVAGRKFLAGDEMSIADISFVCDITELTGVLGVPIGHVAPGIKSWMERMVTELPEYEELITKPIAEFKTFVEGMIGQKIE